MTAESFETRIDALVSEMTLEEKASQLLHEAQAVERLGIPAYDWWNECLHGVARSGRATVFPQAIGLAATFDRALLQETAEAIALEARAKHHAAVARGNRSRYTGLTFWTPNVNIFRDPRWGRGHETYGEDPFLSGELGSAFVRGLQGDHPTYLKAAACAKHFAVHSGPEALRHEFDAVASEKDMQETYLPAFRALVEAGVEAVMGAYNRTNGEPCCASDDLMRRLREEWGFSGHFLSDCWAVRDFHEHHKITSSPVESVSLALSHGCDLNCGCTYEHVVAAVRSGHLDESYVDASVRRLLRTRFRLGMFDPPERVPLTDTPMSVVDCTAHRELARRAAARSLVLLKNDGTLPLRDDVQRLYLCGHNAADIHALLGNYYGLNGRLVTVLEGIADRLPEGISLEYKMGCLLDRPKPNPIEWTEASRYDVVVAVVGLSELYEGEEGDAILSPTKGDRESIELPANQAAYLDLLFDTGRPVVVVVLSGSPIAMPGVVERAAAVLWAWYPGEEGGTAVARALFGEVAPAGRLPVTIPASTGQLPPFEDYSMAGRTYKYMSEPPLFPFGYGLSYGTCRYLAIAARETVRPCEALSAVVTVENAGSADVEEVVQLYLHHSGRPAVLPSSELVGFERVTVPAGQRLAVPFRVCARQLTYVDDAGCRRCDPGPLELIASGAAPCARSTELGVPSVCTTVTVVEG